MFIKWANNAPVGDPSFGFEDASEPWYPCIYPGKRKAVTQTAVFTFSEEVFEYEGATYFGVVYVDWVGSEDPLDAPVQDKDLRDCAFSIMEYPIEANDGRVFQFDRTSKELMESQLAWMEANPTDTVDWVLLDNSVVNLTQAQLQAYYDELILAQAARVRTVFAQYQSMKGSGVTKRDIEAWKTQY